MATFNYARARATASRLINRYGAQGAIRRLVKTGTPSEPVVTTTDYAAMIAAPGYSITNRDATLIEQGDKVGFIDPTGLAIEPTLQDFVVIDGEQYAFVDLSPLKPADVVVVYEFIARRQ